MITHAHVPDEFVEHILNANDIRQKMYEDFVTERINGNISPWAKVTKVGNTMFMSGNTTTTFKLRDKTVDIKDTKNLYGRLMTLAKSTRDIDPKGAIGNHEFTLTPRSLFSTDGSMLRCTDKSQLIRLLEMLGKEAKLEQGRLPSEETGCMYECSIDEDATHVLPTESLNVDRGITDLTRFNEIATQGAPQMAVDKEANSLSRVYSYYSKFNLCLFYV